MKVPKFYIDRLRAALDVSRSIDDGEDCPESEKARKLTDAILDVLEVIEPAD